MLYLLGIDKIPACHGNREFGSRSELVFQQFLLWINSCWFQFSSYLGYLLSGIYIKLGLGMYQFTLGM